MRLMVDGVLFQLTASGSTRLWLAVLPRLASRSALELFVLDRGGTPPIPNAVIIPFPSYNNCYTADDSLLIQKVCNQYAVDVFISTLYTSPVSTAMLMVVYDTNPESLESHPSQRLQMEKEISICFSRQFISISYSIRDYFLRINSEIPEHQVTMAHPGYESTLFHPHNEDDIQRFRTNIGFQRPYVLIVGSRKEINGHKHGKVLFQALGNFNDIGLDVLCIGGEPEVDPESLALLPADCRVKRLALSDRDLTLAYGGASALIYTSLNDELGLPVVEAIASGCPVITTTNSLLAEVGGESAYLAISEASVVEAAEALMAVSRPETRKKLVAAGLELANSFSWDRLVDAIEHEAISLMLKTKTSAFDEFFANWRQLRTMQSGLDIEKISS